ncbi:unnamed protein product [Lampetra fluviatilis]
MTDATSGRSSTRSGLCVSVHVTAPQAKCALAAAAAAITSPVAVALTLTAPASPGQQRPSPTAALVRLSPMSIARTDPRPPRVGAGLRPRMRRGIHRFRVVPLARGSIPGGGGIEAQQSR